MTTNKINDVKMELVNHLRNANILTQSIRGTTTQTDTFVATAGQTNFTLTKSPARNIRSVSVQSISKSYLKDYSVVWKTGIVTLNVGASVGDSVVFVYDYGSPDKIFPDFPRDDLTLTSFPRVAIEWTNMDTQPLGLGGMTHISDILITIYAWVPVNSDPSVAGGYGGVNDLGTLLFNIRDTIRANAKSFNSFRYITPKGVSPIIRDQNNKIIQQSQDFNVRFVVE